MLRGLADPHKGSLDERRRCRRTESAKKLRLDERRTVSQNAWWGLVQMVGQDEAQRKLKEVHDKTCGSCGEVSLYRIFQRAGLPTCSRQRRKLRCVH